MMEGAMDDGPFSVETGSYLEPRNFQNHSHEVSKVMKYPKYAPPKFDSLPLKKDSWKISSFWGV